MLSFNISHVVDLIKFERPNGHLTFCDLRFTYKFIQGKLSFGSLGGSRLNSGVNGNFQA